MVDRILTAAGIKGRRGRFTGNAPSTYAVWLDDITTDGPDGRPCIYRHDVTVELYENKPDDRAELALEVALTAEGLMFTKQDRYWIQTEQLYQVVYDFTYYEKRRI